MTLDVEADGRCVVKLQTPTWELNVRAPAEELMRLATIRNADWNARGSLDVGEVAGSRAFWSSDEQTATVVVGDDDETWDVAITVPLHVVDEIVRLVAAGA
jgi:hypothetical protein